MMGQLGSSSDQLHFLKFSHGLFARLSRTKRFILRPQVIDYKI